MSDVSGNEASININAVVTDNATSATAIINNQLQILAQNIASLATRAQSASNLTSSLNKALGLTASGSSRASGQIASYAKNVNILEHALKNAKTESEFLVKNLNAIKASNLGGPQFNQYLQQYSSHLKTAEINHKALNKVVRGNDLKNYGLQLRAAGMAAQQTGYYFSRNFSAPIIYGLREVFYNYAKLETQNIRVTKLLADNFVGTATASNIDLAKKAVAELGVELDKITAKWGISRLLVQSLAGDYAELGIASKDMLSTMVLITAEMEKLGNLDITASQEFVSSMYQNILKSRRDLGMSVDLNTKEVSDSIAATLRGQMAMFNLVENKTVMSLRNISEAFPEVSAAANLFGLSMTEAIALVTPMVAAGFQLGASANSVKVSLQRMNAMTKQNQQMVDSLSQTMDGFSYSSGVGISNIQLLVDGFNALKDTKGQQGVLEFYSRLFGVRQGPRMATSISQLAQFQDALNNLDRSRAPGVEKTQERIIADQLQESINAQLQLKGFKQIQIKSIADLSMVNKMAVSTLEGTDKQTQLAAAVQRGQIDAQNKLKEMALKSTQNADFLGNTQTEVAKIFLAQAFDVNEMAGLMVETELKLAQASPEVRYRQLKEGLLQIGRAIVPIVDSIVKIFVPVVQKIASAIQNLPEGIKKILGALLVMLALTGPFRIFLGTLQTIKGIFAGFAGQRLLGFGKLKKEIIDIKELISQPDVLKFKKVIQIPDSQAFYTEGRMPGRFSRFASRNKIPDTSGLSPETVEFLKQAKALDGSANAGRVIDSGGKSFIDKFIKKFEKQMPGTTAFVRDLQNGINSNSENTNKVADAVKKVDKSIKDSATTAEKTAKNAASKISKTVGHIFKGPNEFIGNTFIGNAEGNQFGPGKGRPGSGPSAPFVNPAGGGGGGSPGVYRNNVATPAGPMYGPPRNLLSAINNPNWVRLNSKRFSLFPQLPPRTFIPEAPRKTPLLGMPKPVPVPGFKMTAEELLAFNNFQQIMSIPRNALSSVVTITKAEIIDVMRVFGYTIPSFLKNISEQRLAQKFVIPTTFKQDLFDAIKNQQRFFEVVEFMEREGQNVKRTGLRLFPDKAIKSKPPIIGKSKSTIPLDVQGLMISMAPEELRTNLLQQANQSVKSLKQRYGIDQTVDISDKDIQRLFSEAFIEAKRDPEVRSLQPIERKKGIGQEIISSVDEAEALAEKAEYKKVLELVESRKRYQKLAKISTVPIKKKLTAAIYKLQKLLNDPLGTSGPFTIYGNNLITETFDSLTREIEYLRNQIIKELVRIQSLDKEGIQNMIERYRGSGRRIPPELTQRVSSLSSLTKEVDKEIAQIKSSAFKKLSKAKVAKAAEESLYGIPLSEYPEFSQGPKLSSKTGKMLKGPIVPATGKALDISRRNYAIGKYLLDLQVTKGKSEKARKALIKYFNFTEKQLDEKLNEITKRVLALNKKAKLLAETSEIPLVDRGLPAPTPVLEDSVPAALTPNSLEEVKQRISFDSVFDDKKIGMGTLDIPHSKRIAAISQARGKAFAAIRAGSDTIARIAADEFMDLATLITTATGAVPLRQIFRDPSRFINITGSAEELAIRLQTAYQDALALIDENILKLTTQNIGEVLNLTPAQTQVLSNLRKLRRYYSQEFTELLKIEDVAKILPAMPKTTAPAVKKVKVLGTKMKNRLNVLEPPATGYNPLGRPIPADMIPGQTFAEYDNMFARARAASRKLQEDLVYSYVKSEQFLKDAFPDYDSMPRTDKLILKGMSADELYNRVGRARFDPLIQKFNTTIVDALALEESRVLKEIIKQEAARLSSFKPPVILPKATSADIYRGFTMMAGDVRRTMATAMQGVIDNITNVADTTGLKVVIKGASLKEIETVKLSLKKLMTTPNMGKLADLLLINIDETIMSISEIQKVFVKAIQENIDLISKGKQGLLTNRVNYLFDQISNTERAEIVKVLKDFDNQTTTIGQTNRLTGSQMMSKMRKLGGFFSKDFADYRNRTLTYVAKMMSADALLGMRSWFELTGATTGREIDPVAVSDQIAYRRQLSLSKQPKSVVPTPEIPVSVQKYLPKAGEQVAKVKEQIAATTGAEVKNAAEKVANSLDEARPDLQKLANALNNLSNKQLVAPTPAAPVAPANLKPGPAIQAAGQAAAQSSVLAIKPAVDALDAMTSDLNEIAKALKALPVSAIKGPRTKVIKEGIADDSISQIIRKARVDIERASGMSAKSAAKFAGELKKATQLVSTVQQALNTASMKTGQVLSQAPLPPLPDQSDVPVVDVPNQIGEASEQLKEAAEDVKTNINGATKVFAKNIGDAADALEVQIDTAFANVFTGPNLFKGPNQFIGNSFLDGDKIKNIKFVDNLDRTRNIRATPKVDTSKFQYEDQMFSNLLLESAEMKQRRVDATKLRNMQQVFSKTPSGKGFAKFFAGFSSAYESGRAMRFLAKQIASVGTGENLKKVASSVMSIANSASLLPRTAFSTFFSSLHNSKLLAPFMFVFSAGLSTIGIRATRAAVQLKLFSKEMMRATAQQSVFEKVRKQLIKSGDNADDDSVRNAIKNLSRRKKFQLAAPSVIKSSAVSSIKAAGVAIGGFSALLVKIAMVGTIVAPILILIASLFASFKTAGQGSSIAINYLKEAFQNLKQAIMNLANPILDMIQAFGGFTALNQQDQANKSSGAFATLAYMIKQASEAFKKFSQGIGASFMTKTFAPFLARIINRFILLKRAIGSVFRGDTEAAARNFKALLFSLGHDMVGVIGLALKGIGKLFQLASGTIGRFVGYITDQFIGFVIYVSEGLKYVAGAATAVFASLAAALSFFSPVAAAPFIGLATYSGLATVGLITLEKTLTAKRASLVAGATKIGESFSNKVGGAFITVGQKAKIVQNRLATAYKQIMGTELNTPLVKVFDNPNVVANQIKEAVKKAAPEAQDGGESLASKIGKGIKNGLLDLQVDFAEKLFSNLDEQFDKVTDKIKKQLDKQRENALDAFDDMSAGIDALAEAEEKLTKKMDYEEKRREMIRNRATDVENYIRERKLAIYEGRYEDARRLDAEERKSKQEADKELLDLDRGYNRDLQAEQREIAKAVIANQKEQLEKQFDLLEEQFDEQVELLKEKGFASKEEFEKSLKNLGGIGVDFSKQMATIFGGSMNELPSAISKSIDSAIKLFDTDFNTLVDIAAQKFGATANVKDPKSILGAAYYMANGVTDAFKSAFNASVIPQYVAPTMDAIKTLLTTTTTSEAITTMWDQAGIRAVNAMIAGIKRTIAGLKGDIFNEFKTKFETLMKELESLATIKITLETVREAEKSGDTGAGAGATPSGFEDTSGEEKKYRNIPKPRFLDFGTADTYERKIIARIKEIEKNVSGSIDTMERQVKSRFDSSPLPEEIAKDAEEKLSAKIIRFVKEDVKNVLISMGYALVTQVIPALAILVFQLFDYITSRMLVDLLSLIWAGLKAAGAAIKNWWNENISPWLSGLAAKIGEKVQDAWQGLSTALSNTWDSIKNWFTVTMPENVGGFVKKIGEKLSGAWDGLFSGLKDVWNDIKNWFSANVASNPIYKTVTSFGEKIGSIFGKKYYGGSVKSYASGGMVGYAAGGLTMGPVTKGIPTILHGGEFVINHNAVKKIGVGNLARLNAGYQMIPPLKVSMQGITQPRFQIPTNRQNYMSGGQSSNVQTVNINVDTFIGEEEWFNTMMSSYNIKVLPRKQKAAGLEKRVISTYNGLNRGN